MIEHQHAYEHTPAGDLAAVLTVTDRLSVSEDGELQVEGCLASDLLGRYGSPLFVISESAIRANYRRVVAAFEAAWPASVHVMYAVKANNNLAVRAIINSEGGGGDCFGLGEMYATFRGGADAATVVLNGSNKSLEELDQAVARGITVNIDAEDEIDALAESCRRAGRTARVNLRLKAAPLGLDAFASDFHSIPVGRLTELVRREKWGFSTPTAARLLRSMLRIPALELVGYHLHMGRLGRDPSIQSLWSSTLGQMVVDLFDATGFWPQRLDIGGGWARERDPESRSLDRNPNTIEHYARAVADGLLPILRTRSRVTPSLWLEPGRYIVGNAGILLGRVGSIKRDLGIIWVNVDASTNVLPQIDASNCMHHVLAASHMHSPCSLVTTIVGPTCTGSVLGTDRLMPPLVRGDPIVILDAGMYAETTSNQYNGLPRPATVLVAGSESDVIKERETVEDVFRLHHIPDRLQPAG